MAESVVVEFAFKVGDVVQHRLEVQRADRMFIIARKYEECAGGCGQKTYIVRCGMWNKELVPFHEEEIQAYTAERPATYNEKAGADQQRFGDKITGEV